MTPPIVELVSARAALAGNPSDGYRGAVFAIPVAAYSATAHIEQVEQGYEFVDAHSGVGRFDRWADVEGAARTSTATAPHCLMLGAAATAARRCGALRPFRLRVATTIPMSVGLAGSSAIVIASIRALLRWAGDSMGSGDLAVAALAVETDRLGIVAGLQDRVVQVHDRPMLMQFDRTATLSGPGRFTPVDHRVQGHPYRFLVATHAGESEPSQVVHGDLRARYEAGDDVVTSVMPTLAQHAIDAAAAFESGDIARLGAAMDATFDARIAMIDLVAGHLEMIATARSHGAHANYTGSGGSIVVLCPDDHIEEAAHQSLNRLGCTVTSIDGSSPEACVARTGGAAGG